MIIFIKGFIETLNYFIDQMADAEQDSMILNASEPEFMFQKISELDAAIDQHTIVITFNNFGVYLNTSEGNYWENKGVRLYNILVDHPISYIKEIENAFGNLKFLMIDMYHVEFVRQNFKDQADQVFFMPHGGTDCGYYENSERDIDILYVGSCQSEDMEYPLIDFMDDSGTGFYQFCYHVYKQAPYFQMDNVVDAYICQSEKQVTPEQRMQLISYVSMTVQCRVMHDLKYMLISVIADAGMHIRIYGGGWEKLAEKYPDFITVGPFLTSEECIERMGRAKIVLNMPPYFTYGGHERVFNSMLNGAVCASSQSRYLEARFKHMKDIIYVDFNDLPKTVQDIAYVVKNKDVFMWIRQNAYNKVQHDTWQFRLRQILNGTVENLPG